MLSRRLSSGDWARGCSALLRSSLPSFQVAAPATASHTSNACRTHAVVIPLEAQEAASRQTLPSEGPASSSQPTLTPTSRLDFIRQPPPDVDGSGTDRGHLYECRYLPSDSLLPQDNEFWSDAMAPLCDAISAGDAEAAWTAFLTHSRASNLAQANLEPIRRLWWLVAAQPNAVRTTPIANRGKSQELLVERAVVRLISLSEHLPVGTLDRLQRHRLLYLCLLTLEAAKRQHSSVSPSRGRPELSLPAVSDQVWSCIADVITSMQATSEVIDSPLLLRILHQLAAHGRLEFAMELWENQLRLWQRGKFVPSQNLGWATARPRLSARSVEPLLEALALEPLRQSTTSDEGCSAASPSVENIGIIQKALHIIDAAIVDEVDIHKRPLSAWMQHASNDLLWALLPDGLSLNAKRWRSSWAVKSSTSGDSLPLPSKDSKVLVSSETRHALVDVISFHLALRGDLRLALLQHGMATKLKEPLERDLWEALFLGTSVNLQHWISEWRQVKRSKDFGRVESAWTQAVETFEALARWTAQHFTSQPSKSLSAAATSKMAASLERFAAAVHEIDGHDERQMERWRPPLRRLTSTLMAENPGLGQLSSQAHRNLLCAHAHLHDYTFVKDLWVKMYNRSEMRSSHSTAEMLPLDLPSFFWFLRSTLAKEGANNASFGMQLYTQWQVFRSSDKTRVLPPNLMVELLRCLTRNSQSHSIRRVLSDMRDQQTALNAQLVRALLEAFKQPGVAAFEINMRTLDDMIRLFEAQHPQTDSLQGKGDSPSAVRSFLPMEAYSVVLAQATSSSLTGLWRSKESHLLQQRILPIFERFLNALHVSLARRARHTPAGRVAQEGVRQCFNAMARAHLCLPALPLFANELDPEKQVDLLLGGKRPVSLSCADLVQNSHRRAEPLAQAGETRKVAVASLFDILEKDLAVPLDSESWSLHLLSCLLPDPLSTEQERLDAALGVWSRSQAQGTFNYNRDAQLDPRARLGSETIERLIYRADAQKRADAGAPLHKLAGHTATSGTSLNDSNARRRQSREADARRRAGEHNLRPLRLRTRTVARFVVALALYGARNRTHTPEQGQFYLKAAERVLEDWFATVQLEDEFERQRSKDPNGASRPSKPMSWSTGTAQSSASKQGQMSDRRVGRRWMDLAKTILLTLHGGKEQEASRIWHSAVTEGDESGDYRLRSKSAIGNDAANKEDWSRVESKILSWLQ